ncbi:MAG: response regulator transcription factor [Oscillospiraceae bacterium]
MKKVLVVEDEEAIRSFIVINLIRSGYEVVDTDCGEKALELFKPDNFSVVILDIMMPGIDGFTVCKKIRNLDTNVGIIFLSAKSQEMDKVNGLMLGADDYITKPFSPSELVARVDASFRRFELIEKRTGSNSVLISGDFTIDTKSRAVTKFGNEIVLTQMEYQLLEYFFKNANTAISRENLLNKIWGGGYFGDEKTVDVNIRRLRMKLEDNPSEPVHLITVWGYGYKWCE